MNIKSVHYFKFENLNVYQNTILFEDEKNRKQITEISKMISGLIKHLNNKNKNKKNQLTTYLSKHITEI